MKILHGDFACATAATAAGRCGLGFSPGPGVDLDLALVLRVLAFPFNAINFQEIVYCSHGYSSPFLVVSGFEKQTCKTAPDFRLSLSRAFDTRLRPGLMTHAWGIGHFACVA